MISLAPVLHIQSGETITFDCLDASNGQILPTSTSENIQSLVFAQLDQVCGPIYVEGALPGDALQIDVISLETADWGWTGILPGFGLLADEFPEPNLKIWDLKRAPSGTGEYGYTWFDESKGIKLPLQPFMGEMGVARGVEGQWSTIPPYNTGGNLDTKYLYEGSQLFLPVEVEGALFSIGVCYRSLPYSAMAPDFLHLGWTCSSRGRRYVIPNCLLSLVPLIRLPGNNFLRDLW